MRVRTFNRVALDWIEDARWLYGLRQLPKPVQKKAYLSAVGNLRLMNPRQARKRVYMVLGEYAEKEAMPTWEQMVKSPLNTTPS
jgi:hypothetical protein